MRKPRQTKTERLQALWDGNSDLMVATIEFRPFKGWYADPDEARYFYDEGLYLGANWIAAERTIKSL